MCIRDSLIIVALFLIAFVIFQFVLFEYSTEILVSILAGGLIGGLFGLREKSKSLSSYTLTLDDYSITRTKADTPFVRIPLDEITQIIQTWRKRIIVMGKTQEDIIHFPPPNLLENHDELVAKFTTIMPIGSSSSLPYGERFNWISALIYPISFLILIFTENKIIAVLSCLLLIVTMFFQYKFIQRSKNLPNHYKNSNWLALVSMVLVLVTLGLKIVAINQSL